MSRDLTDDQAQLAHERQRLRDARTKRDGARDAGTRFFYTCAVLGWQRSIEVLERRIDEAIQPATITET